ncbi:MAG: hypothetical protein OEV42_10300 [Deltaproteobacteria bacterium]|nr:hypothetical protein [Deltaproteobacteria bacterium]
MNKRALIKKQLSTFFYLLAIAMALNLTACGGGGGGWRRACPTLN